MSEWERVAHCSGRWVGRGASVRGRGRGRLRTSDCGEARSEREPRASGMSEQEVTERELYFGIRRSRAFCHRISRPFHKAFRVLAFSARRRVAGATSCARYDFLLC